MCSGPAQLAVILCVVSFLLLRCVEFQAADPGFGTAAGTVLELASTVSERTPTRTERSSQVVARARGRLPENPLHLD